MGTEFKAMFRTMPKVRMQFTHNGVNAVIIEYAYWFGVYAECPEYKQSKKLQETLEPVHYGITYVGTLYDYGISGTFVGIDTMHNEDVDFKNEVSLLSLNDVLHIAFRMCNLISENRKREQLRAELYSNLESKEE